MDVNTLTQDLTSNVTSNLSDVLMKWMLVPSIVMTLLFLVVLVANNLRRRRVENAIFEIRDLLRDMQSDSHKEKTTPNDAVSQKG
ncbi:MAG: hypothetical protein WAW63_02220 [Candidatus Saccharimonadales bacterium]|jgi:hypothetical protein|nr:hypothetical protein [Candidatus Saccharibacteria bacterium]